MNKSFFRTLISRFSFAIVLIVGLAMMVLWGVSHDPSLHSAHAEITSPQPKVEQLQAPPLAQASGADYFIRENAWMCHMQGTLDQINALEKVPYKTPEIQSEINKYIKLCSFAFCKQKVTVMDVDDKYVFVCERVKGLENEPTWIYCNYALISDLRDNQNNLVDFQSLIKLAHQTTMANIAAQSICKK